MRARTILATALICLTLTATIPLGPAAGAPAYGWSAPFRVSATGEDVAELEIKVLPGDGALAVWTSFEGPSRGYASYATFSPTDGWSQATRLTSGLSDVTQLSLSVNAAGYGLLTWREFAGVVPVAMASFYRPGTGFTPAQILNEDPATMAGAPASALDEIGASTATWAEFNGSLWNRLAARGDAVAGTWEAPTYIEFNDSGTVDFSMGALATNATGGVVAVWQQMVSAIYRYHSSTYTPGAGWSPAVQIENSSDSAIAFIRLGVLADGRAVALWGQVNASGLLAPEMTTYSPTTGWAAASRALGALGDSGVRRPFLSCGGIGACVAGWVDTVGGVDRIAVTRTTDGGATFTPPEVVEPTFEGSAQDAQAALGPTGEGILAWSQDPAPMSGAAWPHAYAAPISAQNGVGATVRLDQADNQRVQMVRASVSSGARWLAGWLQDDGIPVAAYVRSFVPLDVTPPTIRITSPVDGSSLMEASAVVAGVMDGGTSVAVNGIFTPVRKDGTFTVRVPLSIGPNVIRASTQDEAGNSAAATVNVTVVDSSAVLAAELAQANLTIVWLLENQTNITVELRATEAFLSTIQSNLSLAQANASAAQTQSLQALAAAQAASASAATGQSTLSDTQQDLGRTQEELNVTRTKLSSAQSTASMALIFGAGGLLLGVVGAALAMKAIRNMKRWGGGGGGGQFTVDRQTPKRDFGDRMKAGMDTAGGLSGPDASLRDAASGMPTGKRQHGWSPTAGVDETEVQAPRDAASGQASGKRQHGAPGADEGIGSQGEDEVRRGPRQSTSLDGSYDSQVDRDAASGQATGKRQHGALQVDEGIGSQGQDGVSREASAPRDSASGQATGKREAVTSPRDAASGQASGKRVATGDVDGDGMMDTARDSASGQATGKRESVASPRDAASGQASGKRRYGAPSADEGIGSQGQDGVSREATAPRDSASGQATGKREAVTSPRDAASGQASGKRVATADVDGDGMLDTARDSASGQATGKRESVASPRDAASGQATGKSASPSPPSGSEDAGITIDESGTPKPKGKKPGV